MRVLYFGDSHLTCLWQAANEETQAPNGLQESFFAATIPHLERNVFTRKGKKIFASNEKVRETFTATGNSEVIDLREFDACVVVGYCTSVNHIYDLLLRRFAFLPAPLFNPERYIDYFLSRETYEAFLMQGMASYPEIKSLLSDVFQSKLFFFQRPLMSQDWPSHKFCKREDAITLKRALYQDIVKLFSAKLETDGAKFIAQPSETIKSDISTDPRFSLGSEKLYGLGKHPLHDFAHMNKAFGEIGLLHIRQQASGI